MRKVILASFATVFAVGASLAFARDPIHDGRLEIKPAKDDHFEAAEYTLGKAELYGYVSDLKDTKKITGILLLRGDKATPNQKHLIAITAKAQSARGVHRSGRQDCSRWSIRRRRPSPRRPRSTTPARCGTPAAATTPATTDAGALIRAAPR